MDLYLQFYCFRPESSLTRIPLKGSLAPAYLLFFPDIPRIYLIADFQQRSQGGSDETKQIRSVRFSARVSGPVAGRRVGAKRHRRRREGHVRRRDAGRHCRSVAARRSSRKSGRSSPTDKATTRSSISVRASTRHVHAARVQHRQARRRRAAHQLHRNHQRRPARSARSKKRSPCPATRRWWTCRTPCSRWC